MDGPYGNPAIDIDGDKYKIFMMISGGIGITPMQSITNELLE
jgi:ferredoxin-NADP reductase